MTSWVWSALPPRRLAVLLAAGLFVFLVFGGLTSLELDPSRLIITHGLFEVASIVLGCIAFFITWYGNGASYSIRATTVSLVVLSSVIFELVHTLTFPGTTVITADYGYLWATSWLLSRLIWSFGLMYAVCLPPLNGTAYCPLSTRTLLYCTLVGIAAIAANIMFSQNLWAPLLLISHNQNIAAGAQYAACLADACALLILRRAQPDHVNRLTQIALFCGLLTDLSFSLALHSSANLNVAGHFFKTAANLFVLRSLYIMVIRQPYEEVIKLKESMEALAEKNAKLYQESEQHRNMFEDILAKIGMLISSQLDLRETMDAIADMIADMMRARQSAIALFTKDRSALQVAATYGINTPPEFIPLENSLAGRVCQCNSAQCIDDLTLHPELFRPQLIFTSIRSIICAPLVNDREIIGVIEAYSSEKSAFNERDALLLRALGYHAGAAVASATLYEQTKMRLDEEQFLYQIAQSSASTIDTDTIMQQCTAHAARALSADIAAGFLLADQTKDVLSFKASVGLTNRPANFSLSDYPRLAETVDSLVPAAADPDIFPPLNKIASDNIIRQAMLMPLPVDNRLLGLIILGWNHLASAGQPDRRSFATLMAQQIALGLEKAMLYNQVKTMALSDGLTGLANRRNFDMFLSTELRRAATLKRSLSLIMLDLDKFKTYNDTYGHPTGDKLLAQLGKILQETVRNIDFPARYGGEEFSVILPECNNTEAVALAEKIRKTVEKTAFPDNQGARTARITASLGVATYDPALVSLPPDSAKFIAIADEALYKAKQAGRNQVVNSTVI